MSDPKTSKAPASAAPSATAAGAGKSALPPTHPSHGPMEAIPRDEHGRISAYYYCTPEEIEAFGLTPGPLRTRADGWTPDKQVKFIETLAATASVSDAARAVGMSRKSAYALRNRADAGAFRAAWAEALRCATAVLAATAFDRAVNGVEEPIYHKDQIVGHRTRYNDRLLMFLLRVRDPMGYAPIDDLEGWRRHRDLTPEPRADQAAQRLLEAERAWEQRLEAPLPSGIDSPALAPSETSSVGEQEPGADADADWGSDADWDGEEDWNWEADALAAPSGTPAAG